MVRFESIEMAGGAFKSPSFSVPTWSIPVIGLLTYDSTEEVAVYIIARFHTLGDCPVEYGVQ